MSMYFPCKLKSDFPISRLNDRWNRWQKRQIDSIHHSHAPLTDLMDKTKNRDINEALLKVFQKVVASGHAVEERCAPYGLKCLQFAYRKRREDNVFSKNVQVLLSSFTLEYNVKNSGKTLTSEGVLLLNVNADSSVATLIVVLNFSDFHAIDLVYLKHVFYKRLLVSISEHDMMPQDFDCSDCSWLGCRKIVHTHPPAELTMQDFINEKGREISLLNKLEYDFDYRARYSFVKLFGSISFVSDYDEFQTLKPIEQMKNINRLKELYGIISADECFDHYPVKRLFDIFKSNDSTRVDYDIYVSGLNALVVTKDFLYRKSYSLQYIKFRDGYNEPRGNIKTDRMKGACIPGLTEGCFPSFLKTVEVHYLINKVATNEIAIHERSFLNPIIFIKRLWLLWEILYEVDTHKYHVSNFFQKEFGILKQLDNIRNEYNSLLNHSVSYSMAVVTVIAAIFTFLQIWK